MLAVVRSGFSLRFPILFELRIGGDGIRCFDRSEISILLLFSDFLRPVFNEMQWGISSLLRFRFSLHLQLRPTSGVGTKACGFSMA
jgi:hypothetical protein